MPDYLVLSKNFFKTNGDRTIGQVGATVAVTLILLLGNGFNVVSFQLRMCLAQAYLPPARPSPWGMEALEPQKVEVLAP